MIYYLLHSIGLNLAAICYGGLLYIFIRISLELLIPDVAVKMDRPFTIMLNFIWAWICLLIVDLIFTWVAK